jgi:transposase
MQIHSVGIDLGKTTFPLVALGAAGKVLVKKKFTQRQLLTHTANLQTSLPTPEVGRVGGTARKAFSIS